MLTIGPIILAILAGLTNGYSAILLPQLDTPQSKITIDINSESWIASLAVIPQSIGSISSGIIMEIFGRKRSQIISCIPFAIGWLLFVFSENIETLLVGRLVTGFMTGFIIPATTVFIGEAAIPKYRGFLLSSLCLGISFGVLCIHVLGIYLSWKTVALISSILPAVCFVQMFFIPESPAWLIRKGKIDEGKRAFYWFRGYSNENTEELTRVIEAQKCKNEGRNEQDYGKENGQDNGKENSQNNGKEIGQDNTKENRDMGKGNCSSFQKLLKNILKPEFYKPFLIICLYNLTTQGSGKDTIAFYTVSVMESTVKDLDKYIGMVIIDLIRLLFSILACVLVERSGRKLITQISGHGTAISLLLLALVTHFSESSNSVHSSVPLILLIAFTAFVTIGLVPISWALIGEIFPTNLSSFGGSVSGFFAVLFMFGEIKSGPFMFTSLGSVTTYGIYGMICLAGTACLYFVMPETKGKSLQEIEDGFKKKKCDNQNRC